MAMRRPLVLDGGILKELPSGDSVPLADAAPWSGITSKPSTFPPEAHDQAISTITGLQTALDAKAPLNSPTFTGTPTAPTPSGSDDSTKLATTEWVQDKLAALPTGAGPLRIVAFTSGGTWNRGAGTTKIVVWVVGGGGGGRGSTNGGSGGNSSFGSHCTANGGAGGASGSGGGGGTASGGDVNLTGRSGWSWHATGTIGFPGPSGLFGRGAGGGSLASTGGLPGGEGGFAMKVIDVTSISSETVTIGSAGSAGTDAQAGTAGLVIVWEF